MNPTVVFYEVVILFIIMLAGFLAAKTKILKEEAKRQLSSFIVNITLPVVIFMSSQMEFTSEKIENSLWLLAMSVTMFVISIGIAAISFKKSGADKEKVLKFATVFSNSAYMGFPVLFALLGSEGIFYGAVFLFPFNVFLWTYGVLIFKKHSSFKHMMKDILSPSMIAMFVAFAFLGFGLRIPFPINKGLDVIGGLTTPLSMIVIGGTLATVKFKTLISDKWIYIVSAIRLLLLPAISYGLFFWMAPPYMSLTILVLLVGMPCAAATTIFAQQYGGNTKLASGLVSFSTLLSIVTIPLLILVFL
ncbi:MAG: AEC family transporter [Clostridiales bacterium]|nr:AEC family transporter [Clostridiales bacterium]